MNAFAVTPVLLLACLLALGNPAPALATGYHVYDWKGPAREKKGHAVRESQWQPGFLVTREGQRREGEISVTTRDGRIAEVAVKGDGQRRRNYATSELSDFGLLLSVNDLDARRGSPAVTFGPGTLELADGRRLEGLLGAAELDDGTVYTIAHAPDRASPLTSYFSADIERAVFTVDGIAMEYLSSGEGISKVPTLAEYRTHRHADATRNPHPGWVLLASGERIEGEVLLHREEDHGPALGAMLFGEDGIGVFWIASELARVTQLVDGQPGYWISYGASLEALPDLATYAATPYRDESRNPHPGRILRRDGSELLGQVALVKSRDGVNSIEVLYFDAQGVPWSYGGARVHRVTQRIDGSEHHYLPYHDLVFVELLSVGEPYRVHANPFPEREDQFKTALARGLLSVLVQGGAQRLGQEGLAGSAVLGVLGCGPGGGCSSRSALREAVETMAPRFAKDEYVLRRADGSEVIVFNKTFEDQVRPLLESCPGHAALTREERRALLDFDEPGRAASWLNACAGGPPAPVTAPAPPAPHEAGAVFSDPLRDGGQGPAMVVLPAGVYRMGDASGRHAQEIPVQRIDLQRPRAISRYEITLEEFDRFTGATGRLPRSGQISREPRSPARGIAWIDAVAYTEWLSGQTGRRYRLPSEAEWEYAARAGSETPYPWGAAIEPGQVLCLACGDRQPRNEEVGRYPANAFGLHDVVGGVWEWARDCWHPEYSGAPRDGSAWLDAGDCNLRVLRGGSAADAAEHLRVSFRTAANPVVRAEWVGFRVVREME